MNLLDKNVNYIIISAYSAKKSDYDNTIALRRLENKLYLKEYSIYKLNSGNNECYYYAYKNCTNKELRYDAIELLDEFKQEYIYVKYFNESDIKKIFFDGMEKVYTIENYQGNNSSNDFFENGYSFSFKEKKMYYTPSKTDLKEGIIYEYKNNSGIWLEKKVIDPEREYNNLFELLIKYKRIRISY